MRMGRPNKKRRPSSKPSNTNATSNSKSKSNNSNTTSKIVKTATNPNPPKFSSPTLVVGQVSSNVIHSMLAPTLTDMAIQSLEGYADEVLVYENSLSSFNDAEVEYESTQEVEVDLDGSIDSSTSSLTPPNPRTPPTPPSPYRLFSTQSDIDEFTTLLTETAQQYTSTSSKSSSSSSHANLWKIHANAAKFERLLNEKYGRLRPFITAHPEIEAAIKTLQRKYAMGAFSPVYHKELPMFMMQRNGVRVEGLVLGVLFLLVGLKPWALVGLVCVGRWMVEGRRGKRVGGMPKRLRVVDPYYAREDKKDANDGTAAITGEEDEETEKKIKYSFLETPVGTKFNPADLSLADERYDTILLGSGPETLYTAALLSRAGRKTLVLSPEVDASGCHSMTQQTTHFSLDSKIPFDISSSNVAHVSKQQSLLAPALVTNSDYQGGIRFARIGSSSDGYAHTIMSVPGLGTDASSHEGIPVVITAGGPAALAEYTANYLGDGFPGVDLEGKDNGNSVCLGYIAACRQIHAGAGEFYRSKLYPLSRRKAQTVGGGGSSFGQSQEEGVYRQAALRPTTPFLNKCLPLHTHVRSLFAAIGMAHENLSPNHTSMAAHVSNVCSMTSEEGMAYPVGGPRAVCHALGSVVEQCGGRVVTGVVVQELLFEENGGEGGTMGGEKGGEKGGGKEQGKGKKKKKEDAKEESKDEGDVTPHEGPKPRCIGVRLENGMELKTCTSGTSSQRQGSVISFLGLIPTFLHLLPPQIRTKHGVPPGLPAISERRPLLKLLLALNGTREELSITGADWYRLPNASVPLDEMDGVTGQVKFGTIGLEDGEENDGTMAEGEATSAEGEASSTPHHTRGKRSKATPSPSTPSTAATSTTSTTATSSSTSSPKKQHRHKFTSSHSWMKVSFPSAKDPSWHERHGKLSTCVVTIEADDDFVRMFDTKPKIYSILKNGLSGGGEVVERLKDRVLKDLFEVYPQLQDKVEALQIIGPLRSGSTHNPARFAIPGNRPSQPYPNLYLGGSELTISDSFSGSIVGGWLAANAIMGYSVLDHMYLGKNLTSDLGMFLEEPSLVNERDGVVVEDLAVPYKELEVEVDEKKGENEGNASGDGGGGGTDSAAESSKEE